MVRSLSLCHTASMTNKKIRVCHVVVFPSVIRLGLTLVCAVILPAAVGLAVSPSAPLVPVRVALAPVDTDRPRDTLDAQLAMITTDTGAFAPGHRDFSNYDTPGLCLAAARVTRINLHHSLAAQEIGDTLAVDTIGLGGTAPVARACGARFTLANTNVQHLNDLFGLALYEQNDTLAQAIWTKMMGLTAPPSGRDTLAKVLGPSAMPPVSDGRAELWRYLAAYIKFARLAPAEALLAQADTDSRATPAIRAELHSWMGMQYFKPLGDTARFRHELERIIVTAQRIPDIPDSYHYVLSAYRQLMDLAAIEDPKSMPAMARRAVHDLEKYPEQDDRITWGTLPIDSVVGQLAPEWYTYRWKNGGKSAPPLQADYWFPAPGRPSGDTVRPVPGKINLVCLVGALTNNSNDVFNHSINTAYQKAAHIRQWLQQYGAAGLTVTIVQIDPGYTFVDLQDHVMWRLFQSPAERANLWRWLVQDYEQLPVPVAVQDEPTDAWLPMPDGRRLHQKDSQAIAYLHLYRQWWYTQAGAGDGGACTIIGRDGVILDRSNSSVYVGTTYAIPAT